MMSGAIDSLIEGAVLEAYSSLEENEFVDGFANETHNAQAALFLLANHFPSEQWEIPDELRRLPS